MSPKWDAARSAYLKLPPSVKALCRPLLVAIPVSARYGKTYRMIREQAARSETDAEFVRQYQVLHWGASCSWPLQAHSIHSQFEQVSGPISGLRI